MAGEDRFAALSRQLTEQLRHEHERQVSELVAEIRELKSRLRDYEQSSPQHGPAPLAQDTVATPEAGQQKSIPSVQSSPKRKNMRHLSVASAASFQEIRARNFCLRSIEKAVRSNSFEMISSLLITLNGILLAVEAQYNSISIASSLDYRDRNTLQHDWDGARDIFNFIGWVFGICFLVELLMRIVAYRSHFPREIWNWLDTLIVCTWAIGEALPDIVPVNPGIIRLARFARLVRLLKLVRRIGGFDSLFLMMTSLAHSSVILAWTGCLLLLVMTFTALLMNGTLTEFYFENEGFAMSERREVFRYYGSFTTSLFSMFELTLANWPPISRMLYEKVSPVFIVLTLIHKLTIGFSIIGVINGVFIQETFKVAQQDDEIMLRRARQASRTHAKKMRRLMNTADSSGEGTLDLEEFRRMFQDPAIKAWFASMEFNPGDVDALFQMMDDGDGSLTVDEVIAGVAKLKGGARNLDLHMLMREQRQLRHHIETRLPNDMAV